MQSTNTFSHETDLIYWRLLALWTQKKGQMLLQLKTIKNRLLITQRKTAGKVIFRLVFVVRFIRFYFHSREAVQFHMTTFEYRHNCYAKQQRWSSGIKSGQVDNMKSSSTDRQSQVLTRQRPTSSHRCCEAKLCRDYESHTQTQRQAKVITVWWFYLNSLFF